MGSLGSRGEKRSLEKSGKQMEKGWDQESSVSKESSRKAQWGVRKEAVKVQGKNYPKKKTSSAR